MATYINNLRLKEITTGDEDGTWGTSTNTNLELIADALGYGTEDGFATDADATITVADGVADPTRAFYLKVTSSATLTATRTLTIAPNIISRVMFIENATTGSQSITISQGSGSNVTVPNGNSKLVYLDGAGATAAVVDITTTLSQAATPGSFTDLTATGTVNFTGATVSNLGSVGSGTLDGVTIGASSAGAGTFTTLFDQDGDVRTVPPVGTKTSSYTLTTSDIGQYIQVGAGGSITIPDATFSEGDIVSIFNNTAGDVTITCSITTAYIAGTDTDVATATLATRGVATVLFISSTVCVLAGSF
jgi:hypothetical protein